MRAVQTAMRDRFQKRWGQYLAWRARFREQALQPASYSLIAVQRATAVAKWLVGLSGAGTVLAFGFYVQSYLSILAIKNDCVSLGFVADANLGAARYAVFFLVSGALALLAIAWPTMVGIWRNIRCWMKALKLPALQPGHEFDGLSEAEVMRRVASLQWVSVVFSAIFFFGLAYNFLSFALESKPEGVTKEWHYFELKCLPAQYDQGVS